MFANRPEGQKTKTDRRPWRSHLSVLLAIGFFALYWRRPFSLEAVTIWPSWVFALCGLLLAMDRRRRLWKSLRWPVVAWLFVAVVFSEAWRVVLPPGSGEHDLRVVTVNSAGEMVGAMREAAAESPDIVLVQESAGLPDERKVIHDVFGADFDGVYGADASIFVRGKVLSFDDKRGNHTFAHVRLTDGRELDVVSLRMQAPHARLDYWSPDCWRSYTQHRRQHLDELREIWDRVQRLRTGSPLVIGGDFNLVPDPIETEILGSDMTDSYRAAGKGWYATALSTSLLFRIDKVWCSSEFLPRGTWACNSEVSDHRYVVADFSWK